jgi:hypothetical protein
MRRIRRQASRARRSACYSPPWTTVYGLCSAAAQRDGTTHNR